MRMYTKWLTTTAFIVVAKTYHFGPVTFFNIVFKEYWWQLGESFCHCERRFYWYYNEFRSYFEDFALGVGNAFVFLVGFAAEISEF